MSKSEMSPPRHSRSASARRASVKGSPGANAARLREVGGRLAMALMDESGHVSFERAAERLGMSKQQLADTAGLPRTAVYRPARLNGVKAQARTTEMLEIIGRIADWAGGEKQAIAWYRAEPLPAFGGRTAEALVKTGHAAAVRDFLDHIALGGFA